jgi:murein DD-endopeptidase MepM/ murein hydrolase activator NlpD
LKGLRWLNGFLLALLMLARPLSGVQAQQGDPPVYVVQPGDKLAVIAAHFHVSSQDLAQINEISNPNALVPGDRLVLPGFPGVHGELVIQPARLGDTLPTLSRRLQIPIGTLLQLNPQPNPAGFYLNDPIILPNTDSAAHLTASGVLAPGQSLLEMAILQGMTPWTLSELNHLASPQTALPSDLLYFPAGAAPSPAAAVSLPWVDGLEVSPMPLTQGDTVTLRLHTTLPLQTSGVWMGHPVQFFPSGDGQSVAMIGVYALSDPGVYPLDLEFRAAGGAVYRMEQSIQVVSGNYPLDPHLTVDPETIDPKVTGPENDQVAGIVQPFSADQLWNGVFLCPGYNPKWINSGYGDRRYYNDDPHVYFHTGVDYAGGVGLPVKAAASGVVVFTGRLDVRGNATFIDHGRGVYTAYYHQSRIDVKVGDRVEPGQVIGLIGATGRVTGAHLHWEVWVSGIQVNPLDWLARAYP